MFQDDALFPHRDVAAQHRVRPPHAGRRPRARRRRGSRELLALVGLEGRERRAVASLSGGERKRVALARALAPAPRVLLLDEPLGALDRALHDRLVAELRDLFDEIHQTAVYVTHDVGGGVRARRPRRRDARRARSSRSRARSSSGPRRPTRGWRGSSGSRTSRSAARRRS